MVRGGDTRSRKNSGGASAIIGKTIGCNRNMVQQCAWLIEKADDNTKDRLRTGTLSVSNAYGFLTNNKKHKHNSAYISSNTDLQCPHCKSEFKKRDLIIK
jgi:hypothetical protein